MYERQYRVACIRPPGVGWGAAMIPPPSSESSTGCRVGCGRATAACHRMAAKKRDTGKNLTMRPLTIITFLVATAIFTQGAGA